jgi:hypothetical protein
MWRWSHSWTKALQDPDVLRIQVTVLRPCAKSERIAWSPLAASEAQRGVRLFGKIAGELFAGKEVS